MTKVLFCAILFVFSRKFLRMLATRCRSDCSFKEVRMKKRDQERIALLVVKEQLRNKAEHGEIRLGPKLRTEMSKAAKAMGISSKQALKFVKIQMKALLKETFKK